MYNEAVEEIDELISRLEIARGTCTDDEQELYRSVVRNWLCELSGIYEVGERWERAILLPSTWEIE